MKKVFFGVFLIFSILSLSSVVCADDLTGRTGVGIGYLYVSVKHGVSSKFSLEGRVSPVYGGIGLGGRAYYNVTPQDRMVWYLGGGVHLFNYSHGRRGDRDYNGTRTGFGLSGFGGGEYFVTKNFTVGGDIGPVFVPVQGLVSEMGIGISIGIHYYP